MRKEDGAFDVSSLELKFLQKRIVRLIQEIINSPGAFSGDDNFLSRLTDRASYPEELNDRLVQLHGLKQPEDAYSDEELSQFPPLDQVLNEMIQSAQAELSWQVSWHPVCGSKANHFFTIVRSLISTSSESLKEGISKLEEFSPNAARQCNYIGAVVDSYQWLGNTPADALPVLSNRVTAHGFGTAGALVPMMFWAITHYNASDAHKFFLSLMLQHLPMSINGLMPLLMISCDQNNAPAVGLLLQNIHKRSLGFALNFTSYICKEETSHTILAYMLTRGCLNLETTLESAVESNSLGTVIQILCTENPVVKKQLSYEILNNLTVHTQGNNLLFPLFLNARHKCVLFTFFMCNQYLSVTKADEKVNRDHWLPNEVVITNICGPFFQKIKVPSKSETESESETHDTDTDENQSSSNSCS